MPTARWLLSTNSPVVDGKIYVIGGTTGVFQSSADTTSIVEVYDPLIDTWAEKAPTPTPRWGLATSAVNGKIYAIGGSPGLDAISLSTVEEYDPLTDTWTGKAPMPSARSRLVAVAVNGKIYAIGGSGRGRDDLVSAVEEYDPLTDTWTEKAPLPIPRTYFSAGMVNGKIYVIGGHRAERSVEEYDPSTDTWTKRPDMPVLRTRFSASAVNGIIYAFGGSRGATGGGLATVEAYNPATDTWTVETEMPTPRVYLSTSVVNGVIYTIGGVVGFGSLPLSTVEAYDTGVGIRATTLSPQVGRINGGQPIAISGSGFPSDAVVTVGEAQLTDLTVTGTLITGLTPPGTAGEKNILITAPSIDFPVSAGKFFYIGSTGVFVIGMTPTNGVQKGGETGRIAGTGFQPGAKVTVDGVSATVVEVTPTLITFTIPSGTQGTKDVVVTNPDGEKGILPGGYTYNPVPVIERIRSTEGRVAEGPLAGGTPIIITGNHFMPGVLVEVGGTRAGQLDFTSSTELRVQTPPGGPGPKSVRVVNPDGQDAALKEGFTYNPAPTISNVTPHAGSLAGGTRILITGTGFLPAFEIGVNIGRAEASVLALPTPTQIIVETPPSSAGPKDVVVINRDGQTTRLTAGFTYNPGPVIRGIIPDNGKLAGGTRIVIEGGGFLPGAQVLIGDIRGRTFIPAASPRVVSPTRITAVTPKVVGRPGPKDVVVQNPDNQVVVIENGFTYNPLPEIQEISPDYGPADGGTRVVIIGRHFLPGARVVVGRRPATTVVVQDPSTIEAVTPPNPEGLWTVSVINPDEQAAIRPEAFRTVGEEAYNYPNPVRRGGQTTFRYVTRRPVRRMQVRVYNMEGEFIAGFDEPNTTEIRWPNVDIHVGLYAYLMAVEFTDDSAVRKKRLLEVR